LACGQPRAASTTGPAWSTVTNNRGRRWNPIAQSDRGGFPHVPTFHASRDTQPGTGQMTRLTRDALRGRAQTVLGVIDPAELGPTLMHAFV